MHRNRKLNRLQGYDYSSNALYFVTSCVQDRIRCLGAIEDGKMVVNNFGKIAEQQLAWLKEQYKYVVLHAAVVMPNHIHAIIEIDARMASVGTGRDLSLPETKIKSLSQLMGATKQHRPNKFIWPDCQRLIGNVPFTTILSETRNHIFVS